MPPIPPFPTVTFPSLGPLSFFLSELWYLGERCELPRPAVYGLEPQRKFDFMRSKRKKLTVLLHFEWRSPAPNKKNFDQTPQFRKGGLFQPHTPFVDTPGFDRAVSVSPICR